MGGLGGLASMGGGGSSKGAQATAQGGVSPAQMALAQYDFGENQIANNQQFGKTGTGLSTMKSQGAGAAYGQQALELSKYSDADAKAMAEAINQQSQQSLSELSSGIGDLGTALGGGGGTG